MKLVILTLIFCCSFTLGLGSECPDEEWKRLEDSCFFFSTEALDWISAKDFCHNIPGVDAYLAYILSATENEFVRQRLNTYNYQLFYHIGATDTNNEGRFVWEQKGMELDDYYTNWSSGEPNDAGTEDCVEIGPNDGTWNDIPCGELQRFVCRMEL